MARLFRASNGRAVARLEAGEVRLLRDLVGQVMALVGARADDPVSRRLFPDASPDPETAAELRDLLEDDLREAKLAAARTLLETLPDDGRVDLDAESAEQWLTALNDLRLAFGTSIGVTEDAEPDYDDPDWMVYQWLTYLQETLVEAVSAHGVQR